MKEKVDIRGRSFVFNALLVGLNLLGLTFLVMGSHKAFIEQSKMYNILGIVIMIASILGIIFLKGRMMMASVSRVLVGGLFIVSGLVKANDPIGFSYKLEEYFEDGALAFRIKEWFGAPEFSLEFFMDKALILSILICVVEIVLGVLTIIGGKIKWVSYLMLFMMVFFTFLTWHTANCDSERKFTDRNRYAMSDPRAESLIQDAEFNEEITIVSKTSTELVVDELKKPQCVEDCGCFGDALKGSVGRSLTPNESLWKDIVLLYFVIWIVVAQRIIQPNNRRENVVYCIAGLLVIGFFSWVFGWYFPILFGVVALLGALWMLRSGGKLLGNHYGSAFFVVLLCSLLVGYVMFFTPIKDYRPYAVGSDLQEKMSDGVEGIYENRLIYKNKKTGEEKEFSSSSQEYMDSKIWEDSDWEFKENIQKEVVASKNPSIMDFNPAISVSDLSDHERALNFVKHALDTSMLNQLRVFSKREDTIIGVQEARYSEEEYSQQYYQVVDTIAYLDSNVTEIAIKDALIDQDHVVLLISRNLKEGNWSNLQKMKDVAQKCQEADVPFLMICNATREEMNMFREAESFDIPIFSMDEIELKIVSRSNPALMVLKKGVITAKYAHRLIPSIDTFVAKHLKD